MANDNNNEAAVRDYLAGALRALDRGQPGSASAEVVQALQYCWSMVRAGSDADPSGYRNACERVAYELARLPPSLLREAVRVNDERSNPPRA